MPLPFSSFTCKLLFFATPVLLNLALTIEEVLYFLHVDLQEAAFDIELNRGISLVNHIEEVSEHPWEESFKVLVIEVGALSVRD